MALPAAEPYCTSRTMRPRTFPSRICRARPSTSFQLCVCVIAGKLVRIEVSGEPRPCLKAFRFRGHDGIDAGESHGAKDKGRHVVGRSIPWAKPQAATAPPYFVCASTFASVWLPTASIPAAQRSRPSGFPGAGEFLPRDQFGSPKRAEIGLFLKRPVEAMTV